MLILNCGDHITMHVYTKMLCHIVNIYNFCLSMVPNKAGKNYFRIPVPSDFLTDVDKFSKLIFQMFGHFSFINVIS